MLSRWLRVRRHQRKHIMILSCVRRLAFEAALVVSHMTRHMPSSVFSRLAARSSVGVFSKAEKLTIYPQYKHLTNTPECHNRCDGTCRHTCTFDGRKWENLAGLGGLRALIVEDNVMCTSRDPYHHHENILVHEFAHTIHHHGLNLTTSNKVRAAYNNTKTNRLWTSSSYAMANYEEYFAEATTSWYNANQQSSAGRMNKCGTSHYCLSASDARDYMHKHDPRLYDILNYVYNNGKAYLPGRITTCIEQAK
ncbi:uncharacterized protein LOC121377752 isoform X2 [Gigantopelta aegis]|uniref:uncharacterized protein LOC121377752 isoform X2 n=1 Tax=Gigantopelta aegis TaxID=1735272 RepID=UPI001B889A41|nr:uncharacterized protein LOC121377752 isoform X2 [Gigantopelta aegis]